MTRIYIILTLSILLFSFSCTDRIVYEEVSDYEDLNPVFSPPGSTYHTEQYVKITTLVDGATIRYTLDGSEPKDSSPVYSDSIYVSMPVTIKAIASKPGWNTKSSVAEYVFQTASPTFDPPAGDYDSPQLIEILCETAQVVIRYTTDGSEPDTSSILYTEPILVNRDTTLKAKAYRTGWFNSQIATASYQPLPVATPTFVPPGGTYHNVQNVSINCAAEGSTIRYTTDGTEPDTSSLIYSTPIAVTVNKTVKAKAFKNDWSNTSQSEYNFIASLPTFNPPGGGYADPQRVTINCATERATIRYTTDGNEPTSSSTVYSAPIDVDGNITLKARAFKENWTASDINQAEYSFTVSTPTLDPPGGSYQEPQRITINCATLGATIRYTTNGSEPTTSSAIYRNPVNVPLGTTFRVKAFKAGWTASQTETAQYVYAPEGMVFVEGGTFNPAANYTVTLSPFYIAKYEVTQAEWTSVMGGIYVPNWWESGQGPNHPAYGISWFDAIEYCNRLSIRQGLTPVYSYSTHGTNPANWPDGWNRYTYNHTNVDCNWVANGYRLPTEMEWEFAARGGVPAQNAGTFNNRWAGTDIEAQLVNYAWFSANSNSSTHPVGTKLPNELSLYDMSGNVTDWVWDIHGNYPTGSQADPRGVTSGSARVRRGCTFDCTAGSCSVSRRSPLSASIRGYISGFRVVRVIP